MCVQTIKYIETDNVVPTNVKVKCMVITDTCAEEK